MADDLNPGAEAEELELDGELSAGEEEFEEITSDEVDRVVAALEDLMETVESENIKIALEDALNNVYYLVYEDEEADEGETVAEAA